MKKTLALMIILLFTVILTACNTSSENVPTDAVVEISETIDNPSETYEDISDNTESIEEPVYKYIKSCSSLEELEQMREIFFWEDKEKLKSTLLHWGCFDLEELLPFLDVVDSIPYIDILDGDIIWLNYTENDTGSSKVFSVAVTAENGDWVRIGYYLHTAEMEDSMSWATDAALKRGATILEPMESHDKRVALISEIRDKHPSYEGDRIRWWGTVDGIATEITYYSTNIDKIKTEELLNTLTITSIAQQDTVAPELIEQISEGKTYKEVKEIIGALRKDVSSDAIVFEYYLSDGKTVQIEFQKLNDGDDINDYVVQSIRLE